jgi:hypothetical protein
MVVTNPFDEINECSYKDWLDPSIDFRQLRLSGTHDTPSHTNELFDVLLNAGNVTFSKDPDIRPNALEGNGMCMEWRFMKLHPSFSTPAMPGGNTILTKARSDQRAFSFDRP